MGLMSMEEVTIDPDVVAVIEGLAYSVREKSAVRCADAVGEE